MSLRTLLLLMALVSSSMIAAVIYTKVIAPPAVREPSYAELRTLERICDSECNRQAPDVVRRATSQGEITRFAQGCVDACLTRIKSGRNLR